MIHKHPLNRHSRRTFVVPYLKSPSPRIYSISSIGAPRTICTGNSKTRNNEIKLSDETDKTVKVPPSRLTVIDRVFITVRRLFPDYEYAPHTPARFTVAE